MKLATLRDGSRDGRLLVVRKDGLAAISAGAEWPTLQRALDDWDRAAPALRALSDDLDGGRVTGEPVDPTRLAAPLPRAYEWVDGSAYLNHVRLVRKARGAEPPATLETDPLVYQGGAGDLLGPRDPIVLRDPAWGLDFESEVCVILGDVPVGTRADDALFDSIPAALAETDHVCSSVSLGTTKSGINMDATARSVVRAIAGRFPDRRTRRRFLAHWENGARI